MNKRRKKRIISVSFSVNDKSYEYAKDKPNSSYYIRELIEEDMKKVKNKGGNVVEIEDEIDISDFLL